LTGTLINVATVLAGSTLGLLFGSRLPDRVRQTVIAGLGLFTAAYGLLIFLDTQNPIIVLGGLLLGGIAGELLRIEDRLRGLGEWVERTFISRSRREDGLAKEKADEPQQLAVAAKKERFVMGFLTSSLVFCVGPMTILGSIQDGLTGDYSTLAIKSVLDGFASLAFASTLGVGVAFSALVVLIYQGGLTLLAAQANAIVTVQMMNEMTAAGGVLLLGIAVSSLLEIKPIRVGNFLPALVFTPLIVAILAALAS
jgi:uncharacterized protein